MAFSSLPTELVRQIIESTIPSSSERDHYPIRQRTLSTLCLVSSQFRDVTQPILRKMIWLYTHWMTKARETLALAEEAGWGQVIRCAVLEDGHGAIGATQNNIKGLVATCVNLSYLALSDWSDEGVELDVLAQLSELHTLRIHCSRFFFNGARFDSLHTLAIGINGPEESLRLLSPTVLPSLRILAILDDHYGCFLQALQRLPFRHLLGQVYAFFLQNSTIPIDPYFTAFLPKSLISYTRSSASFLHIRVLQYVLHVRYASAFALQRSVNALFAHSIGTDSLPLRSLYLEPDAEDHIFKCRSDKGSQAIRLEELFGHVEIVYEEYEERWPFESVIAEEFVARQRRRNAG